MKQSDKYLKIVEWSEKTDVYGELSGIITDGSMCIMKHKYKRSCARLSRKLSNC